MPKINRFDQRLASIPSELWSKITQIDELKGQWIAGAQLSPQVLGRLKRSVLITSTGASTRIEGARLSDEDVEKLMRGIDIQKFTDRDKQEVKGYYELLENIFNSWKNLRFNESAIKHFHKELLKFVKKDETHRGDYKKIENKVHMLNAAGESVGVLFDTTLAYLTPKEMQELIEWTQEALAEKKYHPLLIVGNFLVEFLQIHPFQDGNGRLSRVLTNLLLLKEGYLYMPYISHEKLVEDNKPEYYLALRQSQKTFLSAEALAKEAKTNNETIIPWLDFFFTIFLKQSQLAVELLSKENIEKLLSKKQLSVWQYLQGVDEATPGEIAKKAKVARPTVSQALDKLLRLKKVERIGLGRSTRYRKL
ncbi:MAG: Fic family protein [Candidatus Taylorbacteria bacterium]|nr:Fic family protein [Candidatus Taylorbacteria bacterium]